MAIGRRTDRWMINCCSCKGLVDCKRELHHYLMGICWRLAWRTLARHLQLFLQFRFRVGKYFHCHWMAQLGDCDDWCNAAPQLTATILGDGLTSQ